MSDPIKDQLKDVVLKGFEGFDVNRLRIRVDDDLVKDVDETGDNLAIKNVSSDCTWQNPKTEAWEVE